MARWVWLAPLGAAFLVVAAGPAVAQEAPNPSFYLVNRAASSIDRLYASPAGNQNWGTDRLGGVVAAGANAPIRLPADGQCVYDLRVVYANGRSDERRGVNTCEIDNISFPGGRTVESSREGARSSRSAANPSFLLVNRSRQVMSELYLSPSGDDSWGDDRLGDGTLAGGASKTMRLPPGECLYDLRVVFANGDANERRRLNLCDLTSLRVP